jgi:thymidylate synthase ThyX
MSASENPLAAFLTNPDAEIYCIRDLPEEVVSVLFAYVSRSPNTFRENLATLLGEEGLIGTATEGERFDPASETARRFHEKWVVGYGHASVAEHSVLHYGIERLSILATKVLEDNRLASYTEKSTRYQYFGRDTVYRAPELWGSPHAEACEAVVGGLMDLYRELFAEVDAHLRRKVPRPARVKPRPYEAALHAQVCDATRYLLPLATETMVALTINARAAAWAITKLLSHPLAEMRALGEAMRAEGLKICPTLLRHADPSEFLQDSRADLRATLPSTGDDAPDGEAPNGVQLLDATDDGLDRLVAALRYEHQGGALSALRREVAAWPVARKHDLLKTILGRMGPHDPLSRPFEALRYTFEVVVDYGAFRDIQRHRIGTQLNPGLDPWLGYEIPEDIIEAGGEARYREAMSRAADLYARVATDAPDAASYVLPMAYRKRVVFDWDLREVAHFVRLRSAPQGHLSYRRIAWQMRDAVVARHPFVADLLPVDREAYPLGRLGRYV